MEKYLSKVESDPDADPTGGKRGTAVQKGTSGIYRFAIFSVIIGLLVAGAAIFLRS
jgi:hypothetical protein